MFSPFTNNYVKAESTTRRPCKFKTLKFVFNALRVDKNNTIFKQNIQHIFDKFITIIYIELLYDLYINGINTSMPSKAILIPTSFNTTLYFLQIQ